MMLLQKTSLAIRCQGSRFNVKCQKVFWVALVFSLQQVYLVFIFATVSEYCWSNVNFIDITISLITILLFLFKNFYFRYYCLATASVSI